MDRQANAGAIRLCALDEIPEPGAKGFTVGSGVLARELFVVREAGEVRAYLNSCPHTGSPLDWMPDQFLSLDGREIQCATHDARFRIADGLCTSGPCVGASLTPCDVELSNGAVWLI
ncbi:MAG: Rieske (2Fe-2S) protein [Gammaproteobacteria bacterium]